MLDETPNSGFVLADMHDPSHLEVFGIEDGMEPDILDYSISVYTDDSANRLIISAIRG